jgi:predicted nucleic acid-binding protein
MTLLLDTNIISRLRRLDRAPPEFAAWAREMPLDAAFLSAITLMEMEDGIISAQRKDPAFATILRDWQEGILAEFQERILPVDASVAIRYSHLKTVRTTEVPDGLIAATALEHDLILVTHNVRHFSDLGVRLLNPFPA